MARGLLDYFPAALAEVARLSQAGNDKHNPGEELHHSRGKSMDHADCIIRHLVERGIVDTDGFLHEVKVAWRALALLQEVLEERGAPMARAARLTPTEQGQYVPESASPVEVPPPASEHPLQGSPDFHPLPSDIDLPGDSADTTATSIPGLMERPAQGSLRRRPRRPRPRYDS
jgi:hypothetical protein